MDAPLELKRSTGNTYPDGRIVAEMAVEGARFRVADEAPEASNLSPQTLNGTTVRINLLVADPDELAARAIANGAMEVAPIADQSYGLRQGRFADPFGHHWLIGRPLAGKHRRLGAKACALAPGDRTTGGSGFFDGTARTFAHRMSGLLWRGG